MVLEDNQVTLQTMMGSRFIMGVKDEVSSTAHDCHLEISRDSTLQCTTLGLSGRG